MRQENVVWKDDRHVFDFHEQNGVVWLSCRLFDALDGVRLAIATREGGVSTGQYASMNFSVSQGDDPDNVRNNFRLFGDAIGIPATEMVQSQQTHTTNLRYATRQDCGKGSIYERDYHDIDGLYTDQQGVALVISFADCVPVFLADPSHRVIAAVHAGWRGTVGKISSKMIALMQERFGTDPRDVRALIGPSICADCYEVDRPVVERFQDAYEKEEWQAFLHQTERQKGTEHCQLDLWKANEINLLRAGLDADHIAVTNLCTCCNPQLIFSHRATGGKRGVTVGVIEMV